ncbi:glycosyltransferase family 61 protein [Adhaeribacter radiodurans]|uniref:Glycosyltransferase family 61 protein n=1 Tax=Adhaeribacter radiodurans TaxID=2745197 RepID=A0A7L7L8B4_9BACT|nr:glycosyltransferase family 61 protein [Adhaeribacter radiodurans]QMU28974.1 glycosyltransferase family 61 protein [Adhaeribacter radiodurans]
MLLKKFFQIFSASVNYYYQAVSVFNHPQKRTLKPAYLLNFTPAEKQFLEKSAHSFNYVVDYSLGFRQKELFTVPLKNVSFLGHSGALVWKGKVVTESVFDLMRLTKSPAFRSFALLSTKRKKGVFSSLMHFPWAETSNYHWFLDALPRLFLLLQDAAEPITLIVPQNMPAFQRETLDFLLDKQSHIRLETISKLEKWQVSEFMLPSFVANHNSGYLPPDILESLRSKIWAGYQVTSTGKPKRIYISRKKANKRKIINEDQVIAALMPYQVQIINAEELTYQQQVQLFYNAEVVIAPHGAGLTNILFCQQATVLELHPVDVIKSHYFLLSKGLNFSYTYSIGSKSDEKQNFTVSIPDFKEQLSYLFDNSPTFLE